LKKTISIIITILSLVIFLSSIAIMIVGTRALRNSELLYIFNHSFSVVSDTGSMRGNLEDSLDDYDIAIIRKASYDEIEMNQVIVFQSTDQSGRTKLIIHRVIGIHPLGGYETKGDANQNPDPNPVLEENFQGIYSSKITFLRPISRLAVGSRSFIFGIITLILLFLLITEIISILKKINQEKLESLKQENEIEIRAFKEAEMKRLREEISIEKNIEEADKKVD
jgi:signal peptidase I